MMKWLAFLFGLVIVAIIVLADLGKLGFIRSLYDFQYGDKVGHFILYGILTLLIDLALLRSSAQANVDTLTPSRKWVAIKAGMILAFAITLEELSQQYFSNRTFDLLDLIASYLGVIVFSWVALKIKK